MSLHCAQAEMYGRSCEKIEHIQRIIGAVANRMKYFKRDNESKTVVFQYYRRELIETVEFLTQSLIPSKIDEYVFVFVGAAPGYDVSYLRKLFPTLKFVLFDPKPISREIGGDTEIYQELFTNKWAKQLGARYRQKKILLQCDTRISSKKLRENLLMIRIWHGIMNVHRGAYEMTLPYDSDGFSLFLKGKLYFPVWSKPAGADCRLITDFKSNELVRYGHRYHEEVMMYFNCIARTCMYTNNELHLPDIYDACYDCTTEKLILSEYVCNFLGEKRGSSEYETKMKELCRGISSYFNEECPQLPDWFVFR